MPPLKILVVSNYYPPHFIGGYELGCAGIMERLRARGHTVKVLTSTHGVGQPTDDGEVCRYLKLDPSSGPTGGRRSRGKYLLRREATARRAFKSICRTFRPDIVYFWNMTSLPISLACLAERLRLPTAYYVSDPWLSRVRDDPWLAGLLRDSLTIRSLVSIALAIQGVYVPTGKLDLRHVQFCSKYLKSLTHRSGSPVDDGQVVHWGIDVTKYPSHVPTVPCRRLLYVGQVMPHKGTHTAIRALSILRKRPGYEDLSLSIVGGSQIPSYDEEIHRIVHELGLEDHVDFVGTVPHDEVARHYRGHDILIFPSVWDEPFSITVLEAMASGLAVVGTPTGGSPEILRHESNAMVFATEDAESCANQVALLLENPRLLTAISKAARRTIEDGFTIDRQVRQIEAALGSAVRAHSSGSRALPLAA